VAEQLLPAAKQLPHPDQRPDAEVVIYDGQCRICTSQIRHLAWWDRGGRLAYLSLHDQEVYQRYPDLTHERLMQEMAVIDRHGGRHLGADAVRYLSRRLPLLWWAAPILHFPGTRRVWRFLYRLVARYRYRLGKVDGCEGGTCDIHAKKH